MARWAVDAAPREFVARLVVRAGRPAVHSSQPRNNGAARGTDGTLRRPQIREPAHDAVLRLRDPHGLPCSSSSSRRAARSRHQPRNPSRSPSPRAARTGPQFANDFIENYFVVQPFFAVNAGRHEFDGQMPDWSRAGIEKEDRAAEAGAHRSRGSRGQRSSVREQRFERDYLLGRHRHRALLARSARSSRSSNPTWYIGRLDPQVYLSRDYAPLEKRLEGYIGYARAIPKLAADIRANLRTPLPKKLRRARHRGLRRLRRVLSRRTCRRSSPR